MANMPCAALPMPPRPWLISMPMTFAPFSAADTAAKVPEAPIPTTTTSQEAVSSSPFTTSGASTAIPASAKAFSAAASTAVEVMVAPV